jgi:broad specificity phosphatase PhoE
MLRIYFIRHAESHFNVWKKSLPDDAKRYHPLPGHRDCGITDHGKQQCVTLREQLLAVEKSLHFDAIVVSPLRRTQETLEHLQLISDKHSVVKNALCREFAIDECDFFEDEEIVMETREQLDQRIADFKIWLKREYQDCERVAVISHGDFIHALLANSAFEESSEESQHWLDNAEYVILEW